MDNLLRFILAFIPSMFFGKIGFASAVIFFGPRFFPVTATVVGGALFGSLLFTYFAEKIISIWNRRFPYHLTSKKIRRIRKLLRIARKYGWWSIALLSPVLLSYPAGCLIAYKFFKDRMKIVIAMTLSALFWTIIFNTFLYLFV